LRGRKRRATSADTTDISAVNEDLPQPISNVVVGRACISTCDVWIHPSCVCRGAIALNVITADPHPTEHCRLASIVLQVWKLELVVNSVVGCGCWRGTTASGIEFHVVVRIIDGFSLVNERKGRVQSDRFSLPIRDVRAVSIRIMHVVVDTDFEVIDTVLFERRNIAVSIL
jgi:hypothetical protein